LISIKHSIGQVPYIKELLRDLKADLNVLSYNELDTLTDVYEIIDKAIVDDPPVAVKEGGIIKEGFNEEVGPWILYPIIIFNPYEFVKSILPNISFEVNTANSYFSPIFTVSVFIGTQV